MDAREQRGLIIAATCRLNRLSDGTWLVPSQSTKGGTVTYRVNLEAKTCTCLDHTEGGHTCKHYYAAKIVFQRDVLPDGTVIETKTITLTERKTYKQDWPAYNKRKARRNAASVSCCMTSAENSRSAGGPEPRKVRCRICLPMPSSRWLTRSTAGSVPAASPLTCWKRTKWDSSASPFPA